LLLLEAGQFPEGEICINNILAKKALGIFYKEKESFFDIRL
jgi:hypothetical protein